jgi:hypothetical protein
MKVYLLYRENMRYGGVREVKHVTTSLKMAKKWQAQPSVVNEYESTSYFYSEHEVEK